MRIFKDKHTDESKFSYNYLHSNGKKMSYGYETGKGFGDGAPYGCGLYGGEGDGEENYNYNRLYPFPLIQYWS